MGLADPLTSTPTAELIKSRVAQIRETLLPQYPPVPAEAAAVPPEPRLGISQNLRSALQSAAHAPRAPSPAAKLAGDPPGTPQRLITSTPPLSVKPRSAYAHRFLDSHRGGSPKKGKVEFVVSSSSGLRKPRGSTRKSMGVRKSMAFSKSRPSMFGPAAGISDGDHSDHDERFEDDVGQVRLLDPLIHAPNLSRFPSFIYSLIIVRYQDVNIVIYRLCSPCKTIQPRPRSKRTRRQKVCACTPRTNRSRAAPRSKAHRAPRAHVRHSRSWSGLAWRRFRVPVI